MTRSSPIIAAATLFLSCFCVMLPTQAASFYDQKKAMADTAHAIENTRRAYENESRASLEYVHMLNEHHERSRRYAEENSRLRPLLAGRPTHQIASLGSNSWSIDRVGADHHEFGPRAPRSNSFAEEPRPPVTHMGSAPPVLYGNITEVRVEAAKPKPSIVAIIHETENRLIEYHDRGRIGTFDMDKFSERLLGIKKNHSVMIASRRILTANQESILRSEMKSLEKDLAERAH